MKKILVLGILTLSALSFGANATATMPMMMNCPMMTMNNGVMQCPMMNGMMNNGVATPVK